MLADRHPKAVLATLFTSNSVAVKYIEYRRGECRGRDEVRSRECSDLILRVPSGVWRSVGERISSRASELAAQLCGRHT